MLYSRECGLGKHNLINWRFHVSTVLAKVLGAFLYMKLFRRRLLSFLAELFQVWFLLLAFFACLLAYALCLARRGLQENLFRSHKKIHNTLCYRSFHSILCFDNAKRFWTCRTNFADFLWSAGKVAFLICGSAFSRVPYC